jgi:hypothetical protein
MGQDFGDVSKGKDPLWECGNGYLLDLSQSVFDCPICTCENDIGGKIEKAKLPVFRIKCNGCKRPLQAFSCPFTGKLTVTEILKL